MGFAGSDKKGMMKALWINELVKMRCSWAVKIVFLYRIYEAVTSAVRPALVETAFMRQGAFAPFQAVTNYAGNIFICSILTGSVMDKEFEQGTIHNVLVCGVGRGRYFAVKTAGIWGLAILDYAVYACLYILFRCLFFGVGQGGGLSEFYWLKMLVYNGGAVAVVLAYHCLFLFFGVLFRNSVVTFMVSAALTVMRNGLGIFIIRRVEGMKWKPAYLLMREIAVSDNILSSDLAMALLPCICMGAISLILAYVLFQRKDMK